MYGTAKSGPIVVLELNELCSPIIDRMMKAGELPNFQKLHDSSDVYVTHSDDPTLEPWVQWPTFHTGQPENVHKAKELDEGHLIKTRRIWDKLAEDDIDSLVFGSMNSDTERKDKVFLVPDPWSAGVKPTDSTFEAFHKFISFHVAEHTNPNAKLDTNDAMNFVKFMLSHGPSLATITKAMNQIVGEKATSGDKKWRRALVLDLLLWDVFANTWSKRNPTFATFFANSTAFIQHRYWRHMDPDAYQVKPSKQEMADYGNAIEDSYRHMDSLIGKARKLIGLQGRIVLATALSQEASTRYEHIGGKFVYRAHSFDDLFNFLGGPQPVSVEPVMTHQAWATFETEHIAIQAEKSLDTLQSNGKTIMEWNRKDNRIMFWCGLLSKTEPGFEITHSETGETKAFDNLFMFVGQVNNSQHARDGALWIETRDGTSQHHPDKLPLEAAYDLVLNMFNDENGTTNVTAE